MGSSAIQVLEETRSQLVVWNPPYAFPGWLLVIMSVANALFIYWYGSRRSGRPGLLWVPLVMMPFFLVGIGLLTSWARATFSRETGTATVERRVMAIPVGNMQVPLREVRGARVGGRGRYRCVILDLESGEAIRLGVYTTQAGHGLAAAAINRFLGRRESIK